MGANKLLCAYEQEYKRAKFKGDRGAAAIYAEGMRQVKKTIRNF